jgi:regulatory protein
MKLKKSFTVDEIKKKLEHYCVYQDRCHQEVETKMKEYLLIPEAKNLIFLHLMQHDFLNEERFAKSFARGKFRIKNWGKQRIIRELKFKKISAYNIKTGLKEINNDEYLENIYKITKNRNELIKETNLFKKKKKLISFLMRKGYESDLIYKTVNEIAD